MGATGALLCLGWLSVGVTGTTSTAFSVATGAAGVRTSATGEGALLSLLPLSAGLATFTVAGAVADG
jgi:hypothetical protein